MTADSEAKLRNVNFWELLPEGLRKALVSLAVLVGPAVLADLVFGFKAAGVTLLVAFGLLSMKNGNDRVRGE